MEITARAIDSSKRPINYLNPSYAIKIGSVKLGKSYRLGILNYEEYFFELKRVSLDVDEIKRWKKKNVHKMMPRARINDENRTLPYSLGFKNLNELHSELKLFGGYKYNGDIKTILFEREEDLFEFMKVTKSRLVLNKLSQE